ncbi:MAG: hypothetical protein H6953_15060 [Chromatiaceae bacterium]|nr:hypothetical protein [Chromatiaceae bacterium]MCP5421736.1 hypothetical protein [Chromatiaceae bacterium]
MERSKALQELKTFIERSMEHVPDGDTDHSLVILKAHLLSEEVLCEFIYGRLPHAERLHLERSHWSFSNKRELAMACSEVHAESNWVWEGLRRLNRLRNLYGHQLEPDDIEAQKGNFVSFIEESVPEQLLYEEVTLRRAAELLLFGLYSICKFPYLSADRGA